MTQTAASSSGMRRHRGMTEEEARTPSIRPAGHCRLPTIRARVAEIVVVAEKEQLTYRGFLTDLLLA